MVVCCDIGLVYAAMTLRVLRTRGTSRDEQLLHWFVLVTMATIESGAYLYMSARYEAPIGVAWALVVARAVAAPLLSVYLSMARPHPETPRDIPPPGRTGPRDSARPRCAQSCLGPEGLPRR